MALPSFDNKEWITSDEIPDPEVLPKIHGWNIAIRPVPIRSQMDNGLFIPESLRDDIKYLTNVGRVVAMGPLCYNDKDKFGPEPWVKVGDFVTFPRFGGQRFLYKGICMVLTEDSSMLFTVEKPEDVDPTYNLS